MEIIEKLSQPTENWGDTLAKLSLMFEEQLVVYLVNGIKYLACQEFNNTLTTYKKV